MGWLLLLVLALAGCTRTVEAPPLEQTPSERAKLLTIPDEYRAKSNVLLATAENVEAGRILFEQHCAMCHGHDGRGNTVLGRNLYPRAGDLTSDKPRRYSDGQLFWIIQEGVRFSGMPAGRTVFTEPQMWQLALYVRRLQGR